MIELYKAITKIINSDFQVKKNGSLYSLTETNVKDYPVTNFSKKGHLKIYQFDKKGVTVFPYLADVSDIGKSTDYLCIGYHAKKVYIHIVELKSVKHTSAYKQIKFTMLFVEHLTALAKAYYKINHNGNIDGCNPVIKAMILSKGRIAVRPLTKISSKKVYITHPHYKYDYLILKAGTNVYLDFYCC